MPPRRILFIDHTARMGGGEVALFNLAISLDRSRYIPVVILLDEGPLGAKLIAAGIDTQVLRLSGDVTETRKDSLGKAGSILRPRAIAALLGCVWRLSRMIRHADVSAVHTNSLKSDIIGGLSGRLARTRVIWHVRDRITSDYLPSRVASVFRFLSRCIPQTIIANSHSTLETLGFAVSSKAFVVHDGTPALIAATAPQMAAADPPVVALIGRITRWKGQHIFLQAAAIVLRKIPAARFQLIGSALFGEEEYERSLHELVKELNIATSVEFCGFCEDVQRRIDEISVAVHASITGEPFGQVVIEAMARGKPVIATNGGGTPEIVVDGRTGILVPMGDAISMATAIINLLENPDLAQRMGAAGFARVQERFLIQHTAESVMNVYDTVLG